MTKKNPVWERMRNRYMDHKITHYHYYLWLSDKLGLYDGLIPFTSDQVKASTDPHLNDLPLRAWDNMDAIVRARAGLVGKRSWSLCDTVCCLKAMARRRAGLPFPS